MKNMLLCWLLLLLVELFALAAALIHGYRCLFISLLSTLLR